VTPLSDMNRAVLVVDCARVNAELLDEGVKATAEPTKIMETATVNFILMHVGDTASD